MKLYCLSFNSLIRYAGWQQFLDNFIRLNESRVSITLLRPSVKSSVVLEKLSFVVSTLFLWDYSAKYFFPNAYKVNRISVYFMILRGIKGKNIVLRVCANEWKQIQKISRLSSFLLRNVNFISLNEEVTSVLNPNYVTHYIPNPYVFDIKSRKEPVDSIKSVLYIGEFSIRKNVHTIVELAKEHPDVSFELIGPIKDKAYFEKMEANKPSNVTLSSSTIPKEEVLKKMLSMDCFILPSFSEGMANVVLESMANGMVVLGSNIPGIRENLESKFTFDPANQDSLNGTFDFVSQLTSTDMGEVSIQNQVFIKEKRSARVIFDKYLRIMQ